jgi:phage terminase large subunit-like protein
MAARPPVSPPVAGSPPRARDPATLYARAVVAGRIVAGPHVRDACARHIRDRARRDWRWRFDLARQQRALDFFAKVLKLNAGEFEGAPFELTPWQAFIIGSLFGWHDPATLERRFRVAYVEAGKGNGKSPLAAGIGLYMFIADGEARAEVYAAAAKEDQAMVLFRDAVAMVEQSPALAKRVRVVGGVNPWNLVFRGSFFRPMSSAASQSGPRPYCALVDELHEHKNDGVLEMLRAGFKFRRSPLLFIITNSGVDRLSVCFRYHQHATKVARAELVDERFFAYVCAVDVGEDPMKDEACWIKANPNLGVSIKRDYLRGQVDEARMMPAKESKVRRLHFCQWVDAASPWISGEAWLACERPARGAVVREFEGLEVVLAVDLSSTTDLSALAIVANLPNGTIRAAVEYWTPEEGLRARAERDTVPYDVWVREGYLRTEVGETLSYATIAARIAELVDVLHVTALVFDRWRMAYLRAEMAKLGIDLPLVEHPQGWVKVKASALWMPQSVNELEKAVLAHQLDVVLNPVLTWNSASAVTLEDDQKSRIFSKRKSTGRIDGLVALAMGVGQLRAPDATVLVENMIG